MGELIARQASEVKKAILEQAKYDLPFNDRIKGSVIGWLNRTLGSDLYRHISLAWIFDSNKPLSSKELTDGQWHGLYQWIKPYKDDASGEWMTNACFPAEAALVLTEALAWYSNLKRSDASEFPRAADSMVAAGVQMGGMVTAVTDEDGMSTHVNGVKFRVPPPSEPTVPPKPKPQKPKFKIEF